MKRVRLVASIGLVVLLAAGCASPQAPPNTVDNTTASPPPGTTADSSPPGPDGQGGTATPSPGDTATPSPGNTATDAAPPGAVNYEEQLLAALGGRVGPVPVQPPPRRVGPLNALVGDDYRVAPRRIRRLQSLRVDIRNADDSVTVQELRVTATIDFRAVTVAVPPPEGQPAAAGPEAERPLVRADELLASARVEPDSCSITQPAAGVAEILCVIGELGPGGTASVIVGLRDNPDLRGDIAAEFMLEATWTGQASPGGAPETLQHTERLERTVATLLGERAGPARVHIVEHEDGRVLRSVEIAVVNDSFRQAMHGLRVVSVIDFRAAEPENIDQLVESAVADAGDCTIRQTAARIGEVACALEEVGPRQPATVTIAFHQHEDGEITIDLGVTAETRGLVCRGRSAGSGDRADGNGAVMSKGVAGQGLGRVLGWFAVGLGLPQVLTPGAVNRFIGVEPTEGSNAVMRLVGVQELCVGAGVLRSDQPAGWLWSRVGGDLVHLAILRSALTSRDCDDDRVRAAMWAVAGVGFLDLLAAVRLGRSSNGGSQRAVSTVTINRAPPEVYSAWKNYQQLPRFMSHVESVEPAGQDRWHWVARAPGGKRLEWDAEIVEDQPNRLLAWRSIDGDFANAGSVRFDPAPGDRGTEVTVALEYASPAGRAGTVAASLLGTAPKQAIRDDLRRFKQVLETGEVLRTDGAPEGTTSKRQLIQRSARPAT